MNYEQRVRAMEAEGMTRSDAQSVIDAEDSRRTKIEEESALWQRKYEVAEERIREAEARIRALEDEQRQLLKQAIDIEHHMH